MEDEVENRNAIEANNTDEAQETEAPEASISHEGTESGQVKETSPSSKERKRCNSKSPIKKLEEDEDDGATCPICLQHWSTSGAHRVTSLKCGHLFGQSCIRRWLSKCTPGKGCCPLCKTKAGVHDMRELYAKKICAIDNTEENRLREQLEAAEQKAKHFAELSHFALTRQRHMNDMKAQSHRSMLALRKCKVILNYCSSEQSSIRTIENRLHYNVEKVRRLFSAGIQRLVCEFDTRFADQL